MSFSFQTTYTLNTPTPQFFYIPRQHRLYVQGWEFINWFRYPGQYFSSGAVQSLCYDNDNPVAVAVINANLTNYRQPMIGFFTRVAYRRMGLSKILGRITYEHFLEHFPNHNKIVLADDGGGRVNWETAKHICRSLEIPANRVPW